MLRPSDFCSTWSPAALLVPGAMMSILGSHLGASWGSSVHQKWVFMDLGMDGLPDLRRSSQMLMGATLMVLDGFWGVDPDLLWMQIEIIFNNDP